MSQPAHQPTAMLELPPLFHAADRSSGSGQRRFAHATILRLALLVIAAAVGAWTFHPFGGDTDIGAFIAAVAFAGAICAELYVLQVRPDGSWYQGRAAAESVKTLAWRYAVAGEPFGKDGLSERDADVLFVRRITGVLGELSALDLHVQTSDQQQITTDMRAVRAQPLERRVSRYDEGRLCDQQAWYTTKASWNLRRARRWAVLTVGVELAGVAAAIAKAMGDLADVAFVLGLVATIAAGLTGWAQFRQYATLATSYAVASQELGSIRSMVQWQEKEAEWASFVRDAEDAISREHVLWRANRGMRAPVERN